MPTPEPTSPAAAIITVDTVATGDNDTLSTQYAAIDLGSNSFHLIVARLVQGELQPIDRLGEKVQLAAGLDAKRQLDEAAQARGMACLELFAQRIAGIPREQIRVVGTNTLEGRTLATPAFVDRAIFLRTDTHLYRIEKPE